MSTSTKIEWTKSDDGTAGATWNPVTGCTKVSEGCDHCYAETFAERWRGIPGHHFENGFDVTLRPERLQEPLRWKKPKRIFVNSMSDLLHESVSGEFVAQVFAVMAVTPRHTYQLLTKRHGRMRSLLSREKFADDVWALAMQLDRGIAFRRRKWPLPNVWLGVSAEDQKWWDVRVPALLETPAAVRFVSAEPLLGPVDMGLTPGGLAPDWLIIGGESGRGARPMAMEWVRTCSPSAGSPGYERSRSSSSSAQSPAARPARARRAATGTSGQKTSGSASSRALRKRSHDRARREHPQLCLAAAVDAISGQPAGTSAAHLALVVLAAAAPLICQHDSTEPSPGPGQTKETRRTRMTTETPVFTGPAAEALCLTEDADWETIAKKLGGRLSNREIAGDTGEYETLLIVPAPPETPKIVCLCGSTRFYDQFQQANYDLTMRGEIVLSVGFYPHAKTAHGHGEGVGHDSAEKTALDELHKRKIDLADYVLVVSDETGYFGDSTKGEIRYAVEHGKPVRFTERRAALRARALGLIDAEERTGQ